MKKEDIVDEKCICGHLRTKQDACISCSNTKYPFICFIINILKNHNIRKEN